MVTPVKPAALVECNPTILSSSVFPQKIVLLTSAFKVELIPDGLLIATTALDKLFTEFVPISLLFT